MSSIHSQKATARDVLESFWKAIKQYKLLFFIDVLAVLIASIANVIVPIYYKQFFDQITGATVRADVASDLIATVFTILGIGGIIWVFYRVNTFAHNYFQAHAIARMKQDAFNYIIDHSYSFFSNTFTGGLTQKINRYAGAFEKLTDRLVWTMIPMFVQIFGIVLVLWFQVPLVSIIILAWVLLFILSNYLISQWKLKYDLLRAERDSETTAFLSDAIANSNPIQLFTGRFFEMGGFKKVTTEQAKANLVSWNISGIVDAVQSALIFLAEFALLYIMAILWVRGQISLGTIVLIQVYFIGLGARLWDFSRIVRDIYEGFASAKEMIDVMQLPHEIKDLPTAQDLQVTLGKVAFTNTEFSYNQTRTVLKNINFTINPGEKIALIGPSGAGKSTIVKLLLRLYEATSGTIFIDGQDIKHATLESLRKNISLVPQDPALFHRSLKENIRYGRLDATDEEVLEAAQLAHCHEFIKDLPQGYDTLVGERGIKLSGGERQRVAIARAILKNAPILILDEATSSLDSESESLIQDALDTLMKGKTTIVIAHRLSTIRKMDRIVVIDNGQILEQGTHEKLLETEDSLYKKLWNLQAGGFLKDTDSVDKA